jgi:hypothetical protein
LYSDGGLYTNGSTNVRAVILENGNFVFDTNDAARDDHRRIAIDFHGQSGAPAPSDGAHYADAFLGTLGVTGTTADGNLATMTAGGADLQRRTRIGWSEGSQQYSLRWDGLGGDGYFNFHCDAGSPCTQWTVTATGPATLYLMPSSTKGKPGAETPLGTFLMPFSILLTRVS